MKLLGILGGGLVIAIIGQIIIVKNKRAKQKEEEDMNLAYGSNSQNNLSKLELTESETIAKKYIEDYKSTYPKESIKTALINNGNLETDVDNWINKYF